MSTILMIISAASSYSQNVGINITGNAPAASAGLDVDFTDKGLLIPRVALTALNAAGPITSPTTSLLVYNTATTGTTPNNVYPGYYFWNGSSWERLNVEKNKRFLTSNLASSTVANTLTDITGLSFSVTSGVTYKFKFFIVYSAALAGTGSRWTLNGPTTTALHYQSEYPSGATSKTFNFGLTAYGNPTGTNTNSASATSNIAIIEGIITPNQNGTVLPRVASEVANSVITALANFSFVEWEILR